MEDIRKEIYSHNNCQSSFSINLNLPFSSFVGICQPSVMRQIASFSLQFYDFEVFRIFIGKSVVVRKVILTSPPPKYLPLDTFFAEHVPSLFIVLFFFYMYCYNFSINIMICRPCKTSKALFDLIRMWSQIALHQMELSSFRVLLLPHNENHIKLF